MRKPNIPHVLMDHLRDKFDLVNDRELARELGCAASMISKFRHRTCQVSPALIIEIHEKYGMSIAEIKLLLDEANDQPVHS